MIRIFLPLICAALGFVAASCSQSQVPFAPAEAPSSPQSTSHGAAAAAMPSPPPSQQAQDPGQSTPADPNQTASGPPQPSAAAPDQVPSPDEASPPVGSEAPASQSTAETEPDVPNSTPADRRASTLIDMPVVSTDGSPLGEVKDIIFDRQGRATHLVIAYGSQPQTGPGDTPDNGNAPPAPDGKLTAMPWDAAVASMKEGRLVLDGGKLHDAPSFMPDAWPDLDNPAWSTNADTYWRKAVRASIAAHPGAPIDSTTRQRGRRSRSGDGSGY